MSAKATARATRQGPATLAWRGARPVTLGDWLGVAEKLYAREKLALGQVAATAHDEALYLLMTVLALPLDSDARVLKKKLTVAEKEKVEAILHRRVMERVPAAYLTREAWLGGQRFYVDERVIIPRSYFVEIIEQQLDAWLRAPAKVRRVVDVCTGSGCLAILLAQHFPKAAVDAVDLSPDALEVAKINVAAHGLTKRVKLWTSDVFDAVPPSPRLRRTGPAGTEWKYDVILSNPPYEPSAHVDAQAPEFAAEPRMAHDGGDDGLTIIRKLLRQARTRLTDEGIVLIEVGGLVAAMNQEFAALEPHWLHTEDGADCVCAIHAARLAKWRG